MLVPMITTIDPGSVTVAAGAETWASTLATATGVPGAEAGQRRCSSGQDARSAAGARSVRDIFSSTTCSKRGSSAAK